MIEVTICFSHLNGDGSCNYLIDIPIESSIGSFSYFKAAAHGKAIRRALSEFETDHADCRLSKITVRDTPDKVLQI